MCKCICLCILIFMRTCTRIFIRTIVCIYTCTCMSIEGRICDLCFKLWRMLLVMTMVIVTIFMTMFGSYDNGCCVLMTMFVDYDHRGQATRTCISTYICVHAQCSNLSGPYTHLVILTYINKHYLQGASSTKIFARSRSVLQKLLSNVITVRWS
jgi:hypothetical protein